MRLHIVLILLVAIGLGLPEPAPGAPIPERTHNPLWMTIAMEPARPQKNAAFVLRVRVFDAEEKPVSDASVRAVVILSKMAHQRQQMELKNAGEGLYEGQITLTTAGAWEVWLTASRGKDRVQQFTPFQVRE